MVYLPLISLFVIWHLSFYELVMKHELGLNLWYLLEPQGETSVVTASSAPVWNEEISFIEQFPPLAQRIRVQVLDDAKMGDIILATHFLDLQQISDPTRNGTAHSPYLFS